MNYFIKGGEARLFLTGKDFESADLAADLSGIAKEAAGRRVTVFASDAEELKISALTALTGFAFDMKSSEGLLRLSCPPAWKQDLISLGFNSVFEFTD